MVHKWYGQQVYDMSDPMQKDSRETEYYNTGHSKFKIWIEFDFEQIKKHVNFFVDML